MNSSAVRHDHSPSPDQQLETESEDPENTSAREHPQDHAIPLFANPFRIKDLLVFDDETLQRMLKCRGFGLEVGQLAHSLHNGPRRLIRRIVRNLPREPRRTFLRELRRPVSQQEQEVARRQVLDALFWELTYWKTPELYEELTEGEQIHPGIFEQLEPDLQGKVVLDVGAGSGRASFESLRHGANTVYAVEPSPGLLRILKKKLTAQPADRRIIPCKGDFSHIPLPANSADITLSCSAFTAEPEQGGEQGLAELKRVTKAGGKIVLIWPRLEDRDWLAQRGFHYVSLPVQQEMRVHFRSLQAALRCARRFYARNKAVVRYIRKRQETEVPFSVLGVNPPLDYCWLIVD